MTTIKIATITMMVEWQRKLNSRNLDPSIGSVDTLGVYHTKKEVPQKEENGDDEAGDGKLRHEERTQQKKRDEKKHEREKGFLQKSSIHSQYLHLFINIVYYSSTPH